MYNICIWLLVGLITFFEQYWGPSGTKGTFNLLTYHRSRPFLHPLVITHFYKIIPFTYITQTINMIYRLMCFQKFYLILFCVFFLDFLLHSEITFSVPALVFKRIFSKYLRRQVKVLLIWHPMPRTLDVNSLYAKAPQFCRK